MKRPFSNALLAKKASGKIPVIADIKCFSPKEGDLLKGRSPMAIASALQAAGAPALSVVTEKEHFGGSLSLLQEIAHKTGLPVLRKDFITSREELLQTKNAGASAVLLISAMHSRERLKALFGEAHALGLEVLLETHTAKELNDALALGALLIGINNRDIQALEKDGGTVSTSAKLLNGISKEGRIFVSESGMFTPQDVQAAAKAGAGAVLIGTALLQAEDTGALYRKLEEGGL